MPEARVELRANLSNLTLSTITNAQGAFIFPELPAGNYAVRVL
ncbi:MAG: carboxypeptidase-like regulatory domain-containing protein [Terriglobia bacterium]